MVKREKFVLVNLKESKSKELAQVISNDTCRKILDYLGEKDASESEISGKLNTPISTIHYNMQQLVKVGLVRVDEFKWSEKGKEINLYKLAKKFIIIAPEDTKGLKTFLNGILPAALIGVVGAGLIHLFKGSIFTASQPAYDVSRELVEAPSTAFGVEASEGFAQTLAAPNYALWFLYGVVFVVIIYLIWNYWRYRK